MPSQEKNHPGFLNTALQNKMLLNSFCRVPRKNCETICIWKHPRAGVVQTYVTHNWHPTTKSRGTKGPTHKSSERAQTQLKIHLEEADSFLGYNLRFLPWKYTDQRTPSGSRSLLQIMLLRMKWIICSLTSSVWTDATTTPISVAGSQVLPRFHYATDKGRGLHPSILPLHPSILSLHPSRDAPGDHAVLHPRSQGEDMKDMVLYISGIHTAPSEKAKAHQHTIASTQG